MYCYCVRNKFNAKLYIGITTKHPTERWKGHLKKVKQSSNNKFHNAIRKYGSENFEIDWIDYTNLITFSELNEIEIETISKYNTYYEGYNSTFGDIYE